MILDAAFPSDVSAGGVLTLVIPLGTLAIVLGLAWLQRRRLQ